MQDYPSIAPHLEGEIKRSNYELKRDCYLYKMVEIDNIGIIDLLVIIINITRAFVRDI